MKKYFLFCIVSASCVLLKAQVSLAPSLSYNYVLGGLNVGMLAPGIVFDYNKDDEFVIRGNVYYAIPKTYSTVTEARALSSATSPQYIDVDETDKLTFWGINIDYKRYLGDGDFEDGGLYFAAGIGLASAALNVTFEDYDHTKYTVTGISGEESGYKTSAQQLFLHGAFGYEKSLGNGHKVFGEAFLNIPANKVGNTVYDISLPVFAGLHVGYAIPFGG